MQFPIIVDSDANFHMFCDKDFFAKLSPASGKVLLGNGKTSLSIKDIGTVHYRIVLHELIIPNVCYTPKLAESIYSLFQYVQTLEHGVHSLFDEGVFIIFPKFQTKAVTGQDDIYLDTLPFNFKPDESSSSPSCSVPNNSTDHFCHTMKKIQDDIEAETKTLDNLLVSLRRYYKEIKMKKTIGS